MKYKHRIASDDIKQLEDNQVFVFGSNEAGIHGAGAAKAALAFGAELGKGFGMAGNTFAIPTKDWKIETLPVEDIRFYVKRFIHFASIFSDLQFIVTKIGCGLAGYKVGDIAPLFEDALQYENIFLPEEFILYLTA